MLWRVARGTVNLVPLIAKINAFLNALTAARYTDFTILGAASAPEDSDIFLPATPPTPAAGTAVIPANPISQSILSTGWVGRSTLGQKARMFLWGAAILGPEDTAGFADNFRLTTAENGAVSAAVAVLNNGSPNLVASDNAVATWYPYTNLKYNDFWLRSIR
jgi:hypothetical protein